MIPTHIKYNRPEIREYSLINYSIHHANFPHIRFTIRVREVEKGLAIKKNFFPVLPQSTPQYMKINENGYSIAGESAPAKRAKKRPVKDDID
jgi:hypothetical protein